MSKKPGLISLQSRHDAAETARRLTEAVKAAGMTVFADIDHAKGAADVDMPLRPTRLILFGAARGGTPLMQQDQTVGIDLPLKALVWEDAQGATWLSYNDPHWFADRHGLGAAADKAVEAMAAGLHKLAAAATA